MPENEIACQLDYSVLTNEADALIIGRSVLEQEADAIYSVAARLDQHFSLACDLLYKCRERIVVMGVGKSGHIANKIAATLASTGSPALYVHPGEAKHGDVGMITENDVVLAISNSGETEELLSILPSIKRLNINLISLTGNPNSSLAKASRVNLDVSVEKEACPLGLAPTSSTTVALAMGDALAMAVMIKKGITAEHFALSHPGGTLGRRLLLTVNQIMRSGKELPIVTCNTSLKIALMEMSKKRLGMTIVLNEEEIAGVFTDGDVRRAFDNNADGDHTAVHEVMTKNPKVIQSGMLAVDALRIMKEHKITSLIVVNETKKPVGVVHIHDLLQAGIM